MKLNSKSINYNVQTVDELVSLDGLEGDTVVVTDENRGGVFVYREDNVGTNNGGTIFNGWTRQYDSAVNIKWFGAKGDGVADDTLAIKNAIANGNKIKAKKGDLYKINQTITIPNNKTIDFSNSIITTSSDIDLFIVQNFGSLCNVKIDLSATAYTSKALSHSPTSSIQGTESSNYVLDNIQITLPSTTGTGIYIDTLSYYIQYTKYKDISVLNGNKGIEILANGSTTWFNANQLNNILLKNNEIAFTLQGAKGNIIDNIGVEKQDNSSQSYLVNSSLNVINGIFYDAAPINIDNYSNGNKIGHLSGVYSYVVDNGRDNTIFYDSGEYVSNTSLFKGNDRRNAYDKGGVIEFIDDIIGGVSPMWTQTKSPGTDIIYFNGLLGNASPQYYRYASLRSYSSGLVKLDFNNRMLVTPKNNPRVHLIFQASQNSVDKYKIGLIDNTLNNGVYLESSAPDYGDNRFRLVSILDGTKTVIDTGAEHSFLSLYYVTIDITNSKIIFRVGKYNQNAYNDEGRCSRGARACWETGKLYSVGTFEITTNIPTVGLQPIVSSYSTSTGYLNLMQYHLISAYRG